LGSLLIASLFAALLSFVPTSPAASAAEVSKKGTLGDGYFFVATDGGIFNFGDSDFFGSTGDIKLNQPIVGAEPTPTGEGYWLVASDGGIFTFGDAEFFGSTGNIKLNKPIVAMVATPTGQGYWLFATDGGVFTFGDAEFYGSQGGGPLNQPIVGADATASGLGYYMVASDGGIFTHGDAGFYGSTGNIKLNKPIVGMAATDDGNGYYLVATDGGIFAFGKTPDDAPFLGSEGATKLNQPIVGMDLSASNQGYYLVAADGGIFTHGDAQFLGSTGNLKLNKPIVGMATTPNSPVTAPDFLVNLRGEAEVPGPGDTDGSGFAFFDFTDDEICYNAKVNNIDQATAAHIHRGQAGVAGPVVITLKTPDANGTSMACTDVDKTLIASILSNPAGYYMNVHTAANPAGTVRGQLAGNTGVAVTDAGDVIVFDTENAEFTQKLFTLPASVPPAAIVGADFRPKTDAAYLLLRAAAGALQLVTVTPAGAASTVGGPIPLADPTATHFGMDFNPVVDRIRVISDKGENFRVNPDDGTKIPDTNLSDPASQYVGAAYTNNRNPAPATTTLYDIGVAGTGDVLARQGGVDGVGSSPNDGIVTAIGPTGFDSSLNLSFDIAPAPEGEGAGAFAVFQPAVATAGHASEIWAVNLDAATTGNVPGKAVRLGVIGDGTVKVIAFSIF
jgi:hypothetical protein